MKFGHIAPESPRRKNSSQIYADSFGYTPIFTIRHDVSRILALTLNIGTEPFYAKIRIEKSSEGEGETERKYT